MSIIEKAAGRLSQNRVETVSRPETVQVPHVVRNEENVCVFPELPAHSPHAANARISNRQEIDLARMRQAGMVTPNGERTPLSEEFRFIKRPLIRRAFQTGEAAIKHSNLIMVTSSLPGEGKTYCAINLAMSIAQEMDHTVLLVDADVARPSVLKTLGLEAKTGLMDVLRDERLDVADVLIKTNIDTLSVLPAGNSQANATELLASQSMQSLLHEISNRYRDRVVIFDSPPLLPTSEARVLASHMGQIVMVVEAETTTQNAVKEALRKIDACANISLLYNKGRAFAERQDYGYY